MVGILICGISGKMGATVYGLLQTCGNAKAVCGVDINPPENGSISVYKSFEEVKENIDVIIDFSSPAVLKSELEWAEKQGVSVVLGSTGYSEEQLRLIDEYAKKIAIFKTANFSLGVNLLMKLVRTCAEVLGDKFDIGIIEKHHNRKADAPSGTALMLADSANTDGKTIPIHSVRGGTIVGEHEVIFAGDDEIITLSHSARSKKVFAAGAIKAAYFLAGKPAGKYGMQNIITAAL